jgi:hypothetical protein
MFVLSSLILTSQFLVVVATKREERKGSNHGVSGAKAETAMSHSPTCKPWIEPPKTLRQ